MKIPFNKVYITGQEMTYVQDCLARGQIGGNGSYTDKVQRFIADRFDCRKVLLTTSGTTALEMATMLIGLQPGDEVIMPSFNFVSSANAVLLRGARPVFVDIDPETLNIDVSAIEAHINTRTKAIIPVHYAGVACKMDQIMDIARGHNLIVIEDAAQAVNAAYQDKYLGTIGHLGCYSFHATKNISCGEGGALLINTSEPNILERADILWEKGTNRRQFMQGQTDKYTWMDIGSSFLPADILAAILYAQLAEVDHITRRREEIYRCYLDLLQPYQSQGLLSLPNIPPGIRSNYHIFYCLLTSSLERSLVIDHLRQYGIQSTFHYVPLHSSPMGLKLGYKAADLPITERLSQNLLRLPLYPSLSQEEVDYVIKHVSVALEELKITAPGLDI